jgi:hypothetical protein
MRDSHTRSSSLIFSILLMSAFDEQLQTQDSKEGLSRNLRGAKKDAGWHPLSKRSEPPNSAAYAILARGAARLGHLRPIKSLEMPELNCSMSRKWSPNGACASDPARLCGIGLCYDTARVRLVANDRGCSSRRNLYRLRSRTNLRASANTCSYRPFNFPRKNSFLRRI